MKRKTLNCWYVVVDAILNIDNTYIQNNINKIISILTNIENIENMKFIKEVTFKDFIISIIKFIILEQLKKESNKKILTINVFSLNWDTFSKHILTNMFDLEKTTILENYIKTTLTLKDEETIKSIYVTIKDVPNFIIDFFKFTKNIELDFDVPSALYEIIFKFKPILDIESIAEFNPVLKEPIKIFNLKTTTSLELKLYEKSLENKLLKVRDILYESYILFENLGINYFLAHSIASISMRLWRKTIPNNLKNRVIPLRKEDWGKDYFLRKSYSGGYSYSKYKTITKDIWGYDKVSFYASIMGSSKNRFPIGTGIFMKFDSFETITNLLKYLKLTKQVAIIEAELICTEDAVYPYLKTKEDIEFSLNIPLYNFNTRIPKKGEKWVDVYTSADLEYAYNSKTYLIKPIKGYVYKTSTNLFRNFINKFFIKKERNSGYKKTLFKLILTSLSGKLGNHLEKKKYAVTPRLDIFSIKQNNASYVHLASFITAYGRIETHKFILEQAKNNNQLFYCHTDSFFFTKDIPANLKLNVHKRIRLRKGKLRCEVKPPNKACFLSLNNLIIVDSENKTIINKGRLKSWDSFISYINKPKINLNLTNLEEEKPNTSINISDYDKKLKLFFKSLYGKKK